MENKLIPTVLKIFVSDENAGLRLDKVLASVVEIGNRSRAAHLLSSESIKVNGKIVKASFIVKAQDAIEITLPKPTPSELQPYDFKLDILFEDDDVIVINKPSGLVVHPAAGHSQDTLVNALLSHTKNLSMKFGEQRPGIVHRLDKDTSGIIVVAKNDFAHESLTSQFKERSIHRIYYAVSIGTSRNLEGTFKSFLARHPVDRKKYASILDDARKYLVDTENPPELGKWAVTHYQVLARRSGLTYLKLKLETGRTHQIRVHLSEGGLPIAGDLLYGADKKIRTLESRNTQENIRNLSRFLLHAAELGFAHPRTNEQMFFKISWPKEFEDQIRSWGLL